MRGALAAVLIALGLLLAPPRSSAETRTGAPDEWALPFADAKLQFLVFGDQIEFRGNKGNDLVRWDVEGWFGGDYHKLWVKAEGETSTAGPSSGDAEFQFLYGWTFASFWDLQAGVRHDIVFGSGPNRHRTYAVLGLEGLAPYWFEVVPTLFVGDDGDVSARLTATYDLLLTQRLIAQPRLEVNVAAQDATAFGIESGFNDIELGLRLRYEFRRELAPYIGVNWLRLLGDTADLARAEGEEVDTLSVVVGFRFWF